MKWKYLFKKPVITGMHNIPSYGPAIIAANDERYKDILLDLRPHQREIVYRCPSGYKGNLDYLKKGNIVAMFMKQGDWFPTSILIDLADDTGAPVIPVGISGKDGHRIRIGWPIYYRKKADESEKGFAERAYNSLNGHLSNLVNLEEIIQIFIETGSISSGSSFDYKGYSA
jgi:hypothetical protein